MSRGTAKQHQLIGRTFDPGPALFAALAAQLKGTPPAEAAFRLVCDPVKEFSCERS